MNPHGCTISRQTAYDLLKRYIGTRNIVAGRKLYSLIASAGLQSDTFLGSHFVRLFSFSENSVESELAFSRIIEPDVYSWTALISAFNQHGESERSIQSLHRMQQANVQPDEHVYVAVLNACSLMSSLPLGKLIHARIHDSCAESDVFVGNALVDMYAKCGDLEGAVTHFQRIQNRDLVSWNAVLGGYSQHGFSEKTLRLFHDMQKESIRPSHVTFVVVLKACAKVEFLDQGRLVHSHVIEEGYESGTLVGSAITNLYAKCGKLVDASSVLEQQLNRHIGIWNALATGYAQHGDGEKALELLHKMMSDGFKPNEVTFVCILKACTGGMTTFDDSKHVHSLIIDFGLEQNCFVVGSLIDMYSMYGSLDDARKVFDRVSKNNEITWSALVIGYAQHGCSEETLHLFQKMQLEGAKADLLTYVYVLKACTDIVALEQGLLIHSIVIDAEIKIDSCLGSSLIDFYARCSSIVDATNVFHHLSEHNVVTWSAMIGGYTLHGYHKAALQSFLDMQHRGVKPDDVMFISLLSTCAQMGFVNEGKDLFHIMTNEFGLIPTGEHYNCLVDLLGRVGHLAEAESLMELAPADSCFVGWMTLLSHCRAHGRVMMAKRCFEQIVSLDHGHGSAYALMSDIYASAGMWEAAEKVHKMRNVTKAWKRPGHATIEISKKIHAFVVGDKSHAQRNDIYLKLNNLNFQLVMEGYVPQVVSDAQESLVT